MKKCITILGIDEEICVFFKKEINKIFGNLFEVDYRNLEMDPIPPIYDSDLILYTDPEMVNELIHKIKCNAPTLMMKRTITREALRKIRKIPAGKKALVVNINQYMANETMAMIYQLGVTHLQLYPYWEGKKECPKVDYIINVDPRPYKFLPDIDAEIVIIGHRIFDISNILDILSLLRVDRQTSEKIIKDYMFKVPTFWHGIQYTYENRSILTTQLNILLDELTSGVILTDDTDKIQFVNKKASYVLGFNKDDLIGNYLGQLFHQNKKQSVLLSRLELKNELIKYGGTDLVFNMKLVEHDKNFHGKIIMFNPYSEMIKTQQAIHKKLVSSGYFSKYDFPDLVGEDPDFLRTKNISKKVASSDSTVLLLGESGTGKELFAGSIHNNSDRKFKPFIAINCATLPENLLESELFGYEEGAFTGAKKGGKTGLFERAHKGTLFLDEIGDLPLNLQARLLRALEEKEIMRVGGSSIISVDVRIIAATNRNLLKLVEEGKFRKDLFFRLNIFQITIPPLRKRPGDIKLLIEHFLNSWKVERKICRDFVNFCNTYNWPGNVRELKNVLEYMTTVSEICLSFDNVPDYLRVRENYINKDHNEEELLLKILYYTQKANQNTGRRTLCQLFSSIYFEVSEVKIRSLIDSLAKKGLLEKKIGRQGNLITAKGINYLVENKFIYDDTEEEFKKRIFECSIS